MLMPLDQIRTRYRRLIYFMRQIACLTETEAANAIYMRQMGDDYAGEAVNHYGGVTAVLRDAIAERHAIRRVFGGPKGAS